jgi:hypothetical protein
VLFPTGCAFNEWDVRACACLDVFEDGVADREVDRDVVPTQFLSELFTIFAREHNTDLVATSARTGGNQLPHRTKTNYGYSHQTSLQPWFNCLAMFV